MSISFLKAKHRSSPGLNTEGLHSDIHMHQCLFLLRERSLALYFHKAAVITRDRFQRSKPTQARLGCSVLNIHDHFTLSLVRWAEVRKQAGFKSFKIPFSVLSCEQLTTYTCFTGWVAPSRILSSGKTVGFPFITLYCNWFPWVICQSSGESQKSVNVWGCTPTPLNTNNSVCGCGVNACPRLKSSSALL